MSDNLPSAQFIGKLSNRIRRRIIDSSSNLPYSGAQGKVLQYLLSKQDEILYQKDVENEFSLRPASATEILKKMEEGALIERIPEKKDGRLKRIVLTEKALALKDDVMGSFDAVEADLIAGIKEKDLETFKRVCAKMLDNLDYSSKN